MIKAIQKDDCWYIVYKKRYGKSDGKEFIFLGRHGEHTVILSLTTNTVFSLAPDRFEKDYEVVEIPADPLEPAVPPDPALADVPNKYEKLLYVGKTFRGRDIRTSIVNVEAEYYFQGDLYIVYSFPFQRPYPDATLQPYTLTEDWFLKSFEEIIPDKVEAKPVYESGVGPLHESGKFFMLFHGPEPRLKTLKVINAERDRQVEEKGWTAEFDDKNGPNDWAAYLTAYIGKAIAATGAGGVGANIKPEDFRDNMVKVAAIAVAAVEAAGRQVANGLA